MLFCVLSVEERVTCECHSTNTPVYIFHFRFILPRVCVFLILANDSMLRLHPIFVTHITLKIKRGEFRSHTHALLFLTKGRAFV